MADLLHSVALAFVAWLVVMELVAAIVVVVVVTAVLDSLVLLVWQKGQLAVVDLPFGVQLVVPLFVVLVLLEL